MINKRRVAMITAATMVAPMAVQAADIAKATTEFVSNTITIIYPPKPEDFVYTPNGWTEKTGSVTGEIGVTLTSKLLGAEFDSFKGCWTDSRNKLADGDASLQDITLTTNVGGVDGNYEFSIPAPANDKAQWFHIEILLKSGDYVKYVSPVFNSSTDKVATSLEVRKNDIRIDNIQLKPSTEETVEVVVGPDDATYKLWECKSSDEKVVKWEDSKIKGIADGVAKLTFSLLDNPAVSHVVNVEVKADTIDEIDVTLDGGKVNVVKNKTAQINAVVKAGGTEVVDADIEFIGLSDDIATVTDTGLLTGVEIGTGSVRVYSLDNNLVFKDIPVETISDVVLVTGITVDIVGDLVVGGSGIKATATVTPNTATNQEVTWESSNTGVATIDENGNITLVKDGVTTIKAIAKDGSLVEGVKEITVAKAPVDVVSVSLTADKNEITVGGTSNITATFNPIDATNQNLTWTSSSDDIATVVDGVVTGVKDGKVIITATPHKGTQGTVEITVKPDIVLVDSITIKAPDSLFVGEIGKATAVVGPIGATNKDIVWSVPDSDSGILSIDQDNGDITAIGVGTSVITASSKDGNKTETHAIEITPVSLTSAEITANNIVAGTKGTANVVLNPTNATLTGATEWSSLTPDTLSIDPVTGEYTGLVAGTATLQAVVKGTPKLTITKNITVQSVVVPVDSVSITGTSTMTVGDTGTLTAVINPAGATVNSTVWSVDGDNKIVTIDQAGNIVAVGSGVVEVTLTVNGDKVAKHTITVNETPLVVSKVEVSLPSNLKVNDTAQAIVTVSSNKPGKPPVTWSSSDTTKATVSLDGRVTGVGVGTVDIIANSAGVEGRATLEIISADAPKVEVTDVNLSLADTSLTIGDKAKINAEVLPLDATDTTLSWTSSNDGVVRVDNSGNIETISKGTATIKAEASNGVFGEIAITVSEAIVNPPTEITKVTLDRHDVTLEKGDTLKLNVEILPVEFANEIVSWITNDRTVVEVDTDGTLTAIGKGTTTVEVIADNGVKDVCTVTVTDASEVVPPDVDKITSVNIIEENVSLIVDDLLQLRYEIEPKGNKNIAWSSSDESIVEAKNGYLIANGIGKATVRLKTTDGSNLSDTVEVEVRKKPEIDIPLKDFRFEDKMIFVNAGETVSLPRMVKNPTNATVSLADAIIHVKSGENLLDLNGTNVTGKDKGLAVIEAMLDGKTAEIKVMVKKPITSFNIVEDTLSQDEKTEYTLNFDVQEPNADGKVIWSSSNEKVATVDTKGKVKFISKGNATITGVTSDSGLTDSVDITVNEVVIPDTGFKINQTALVIPVGNTAKVSWEFTPIDTTDKVLDWESTDDGIASIVDGIVTANTVGDVVIKATTAEGNTDSFTVKVVDSIDQLPDGFKPAYIEHIDSDIEMFKGDKEKIDYTLNADATVKGLIWNSRDNDIADVDDTGVVTGIKEGRTEVEVRTYDSTHPFAVTRNEVTTGSAYSIASRAGNVLSYVNVRVVSRVEGIQITDDSIVLNIGEDREVNYTLLPNDATDKKVTFTSDDSSVGINGTKVVGVSEGSALVTVTTNDGKFTDTIRVYVVDSSLKDITTAVEGIKVNNPTESIKVGESVNVSYDILPSDATNKDVIFESNADSIAKVDSNGKITGISEGTSIITVTTADGGFKGQVVVTVTKDNNGGDTDVAVTGINITNGKQISKYSGQSHTVSYQINPTNATNKNVTWHSSDARVANVVNGVVTAVGIGQADITVRAVDGNFSDTMTFKVTKQDNTGSENDNRPTDEYIKVTDMSVTSEMWIREGETQDIEVTIKPYNATDKSVKYDVANDKIVRVDTNGRVKGLSEGRTMITITSRDNTRVEEIVAVNVLPKLDEKDFTNPSISEFKEFLPFTLPVGEIDLAAGLRIKSNNFDTSIVDIEEGRHKVGIVYKGNKVNDLVEGIDVYGSKKEYSDVKSSHWAYSSIQDATKLGFLTGTEGDKYEPKSTLNYQDTFTALNKVLMKDSKFSMSNKRTEIESLLKGKVEKEHWAYYNIASVMSKLTMETNKSLTSRAGFMTTGITRGELAKVLSEIVAEQDIPMTLQMPVYRDIKQDEMSNAIVVVSNTGLMVGDEKGNFNPSKTLTRAELAEVVNRLHVKLK